MTKGSGTFTLFLPMSCEGWPHISFYPAESGSSFGGNYFGTGDSVLKRWWGKKDTDKKTGSSTGSNRGHDTPTQSQVAEPGGAAKWSEWAIGRLATIPIKARISRQAGPSRSLKSRSHGRSSSSNGILDDQVGAHDNLADRSIKIASIGATVMKNASKQEAPGSGCMSTVCRTPRMSRYTQCFRRRTARQFCSSRNGCCIPTPCGSPSGATSPASGITAWSGVGKLPKERSNT